MKQKYKDIMNPTCAYGIFNGGQRDEIRKQSKI
jgi:hypothetical protein